MPAKCKVNIHVACQGRNTTFVQHAGRNRVATASIVALVASTAPAIPALVCRRRKGVSHTHAQDISDGSHLATHFANVLAVAMCR